MPYCPSCRRKYGSEVRRCPECDVNLVDSLEGEDLFEPVELAVFHDFPEAEMIQELLEGNGIRTVLRGEADPIGLASGAAPSALLVPRADYERARRIYNDFYAGGETGDDSPPEEDNSAAEEPNSGKE